MLRNLTLLGISVALTLVGLELVMRLFYPVPPTWHDPPDPPPEEPARGMGPATVLGRMDNRRARARELPSACETRR